MRKLKKKSLLVLGLLFACVMLSGCTGREKSAEETEVLKITITPEATPTPEPEAVNPDAVVTNGNMTMVNEYMVNKNAE